MKTILLLLSLITPPALAATIYEWKDPATGKLMAGDHPPTGGVEYWPEGRRGQPVDQNQSRLATQAEIEECLMYAKAAARYKDPDSARVEGEALYSAEADGGHQIYIYINAKNSYGAYAGAKMARCIYRASGNLDHVVLH